AAGGHLRADPEPPAPGALRAAVAADRGRDPRARALARRALDPLGRRRDPLPALAAVRGRLGVHPDRAPALLDGDLGALRAQHNPRAAAGAAREAPRGGGASGDQLAVGGLVGARGAL